jgi:hypothetical protein
MMSPAAANTVAVTESAIAARIFFIVLFLCR